MVNLSCQLEQIWNHLRNGPHACLWGITLIKLIEVGRPAHSGWHHFLCSENEQLKEESELRTGIHCFLFPDWMEVASCFRLLPPSLAPR